MIKHPHDSSTHKDFLFETLEAFSIIEKTICATTDNASNMEAAITEPKSIVNLGGGLPFPFTHYRGIKHTLPLGVSSALKDLRPLMKDIREVVLAVKSSMESNKGLMELQTDIIQAGTIGDMRELMELIEDVTRSWNTTYLMLERAYGLRFPLTRFLQE